MRAAHGEFATHTLNGCTPRGPLACPMRPHPRRAAGARAARRGSASSFPSQPAAPCAPVPVAPPAEAPPLAVEPPLAFPTPPEAAPPLDMPIAGLPPAPSLPWPSPEALCVHDDSAASDTTPAKRRAQSTHSARWFIRTLQRAVSAPVQKNPGARPIGQVLYRVQLGPR